MMKKAWIRGKEVLLCSEFTNSVSAIFPNILQTFLDAHAVFARIST